ncbi:MAG: NYN domain-containing protein, partial [Actinomycetota bacterium]
PEGWARRLAAAPGAARSSPRRTRVEVLEESFARERQRTRDARDEARRIKEESQSARQSWRSTERDLTRRANDAERRLKRSEEEALRSHSQSRATAASHDRDLRRARREAEKAIAARDELRSQLKAERRRLAQLQARVAELEDELASARRRRKSPAAGPRRSADGPRRPLPVPKGLLEDAPETLAAWLSEPEVSLLVDGYNVTKSKGGFGDLELVTQRDRLIEEVARLARKSTAAATIVFDGSDVPPGTARRSRGPVTVVYSRADETGDDRLIALLSSLPGDPVVVATSDRELQARAAALGANVATARQLLTLLRPRG